MKTLKHTLICVLVPFILLLGTACSKSAVQPTDLTSASATTATGSNSGSTATVEKAETASTAADKGNPQAEEKRRSDEIAMIKEKIKDLPKVDGLVNIRDVDDSILIEMKYASESNFTKKKIYPSDVCALQKDTAAKLSAANAELKKMGYRIKIWDAYRPLYVQKIFWDIVQDDRFVANPDNGGSIHNHGCAVDLTLVDKEGREVEMPTGFDDFSEKAAGFDTELTGEVKENLKTLRTVMMEYDFTPISTEWWHFEDNESSRYPLLDVSFDEFG